MLVTHVLVQTGLLVCVSCGGEGGGGGGSQRGMATSTAPRSYMVHLDRLTINLKSS